MSTFDRGECSRCDTVRGDFRPILVLYFRYLIFWFMYGMVLCGLKFNQNYNHTISHFYGYICGVVYKMRFE